MGTVFFFFGFFGKEEKLITKQNKKKGHTLYLCRNKDSIV